MKVVNSTNPKEFLKLFPNWTKSLPYCTAGRPTYGNYSEYEETVEVEFLWYNIPSKISFKRFVGGSTNFHWGLRDFGRKTTITIGNVVINTDKFTRYYSYQYNNKVTTERTSLVEAPLKRILVALKKGFKPHSFDDDIVYNEDREKWVRIDHICDFNTELSTFVYVGKHTPQNEPHSTYYYTFYGKSNKLKEIVE